MTTQEIIAQIQAAILDGVNSTIPNILEGLTAALPIFLALLGISIILRMFKTATGDADVQRIAKDRMDERWEQDVRDSADAVYDYEHSDGEDEEDESEGEEDD